MHNEAPIAMGDCNSLVLFVDSNFFLQLKQPKELPWDEIGSRSNFILMVPRAVQKEISRLKADGNSRRSRRARKTVALLMKIAQSPGGMHVVRESDPRVDLRLPSRGGPPPEHPDLDLSNTDDQIIAEIQEFRAAHPDDEVALLTTDSDQVMSCRCLGIPYKVVPEGWHLPPEPDARDKRVQELERRVAQLEATEPKIAVSSLNGTGEPIDALAIEIDDYAPIPAELLDELMAEAKRRSPLKEGLDELANAKHPRDSFERTLLVATPSIQFKPPTLEEISDYRGKHYPGWLDRLRRFFETLPQRMGDPSRMGELIVVVRNDGARPSEGTIVTFAAFGGVLLVSKEHALTCAQDFPAPPKPPRGSLIRTVGSLASMIESFGQNHLPDATAFHVPHFDPHDPYAFYFTGGERKSPSARWAFECDQFRHGGCEQTFEMLILVPYGSRPTSPAIHCEVFARNMSTPVKTTIPINLVFHAADSARPARELLDRHLRPHAEVTLVLPDDTKPRV
jgi:hypothetical protein